MTKKTDWFSHHDPQDVQNRDKNNFHILTGIGLVTQSVIFLFFNFELTTRKWKNESLTIELVTWI